VNRLDDNAKTEERSLKPVFIPLSFSAITNQLMHTIFEYYVDKMSKVVVTTTLQGGGKRDKRLARKTKKRSKRSKRARYSRK
jgi:hypothetical protein